MTPPDTTVPAPRPSHPEARLKCVLLEGIHRSAADALAADGCTTVDARPGALAGPELAEAIADAHFLGIRSRTQPTDAVLEAAPKRVAIGAFCIGTDRIDLAAAARLIRCSDDGSTVTAVNVPEVALPEPAGQCRLLHVHHDVPGMLARTNALFSQAGIDVAFEGLRAIPGTIRCRIVH